MKVEPGQNVFSYGSVAALHASSTNITDMEAFIVISGQVSISAPKKVSMTQQMIIDSYSDIIWDKTHQGD
jgi:hypothetical protein